mmetsp:Transcript_49469/g.49831  ORF Transcript_49469/g.49831 Transcript_49469/m.49831 type:complete len:122 (-) Transcript_49469:115-480(-)
MVENRYLLWVPATEEEAEDEPHIPGVGWSQMKGLFETFPVTTAPPTVAPQTEPPTPLSETSADPTAALNIEPPASLSTTSAAPTAALNVEPPTSLSETSTAPTAAPISSYPRFLGLFLLDA